MHTTDGHNTVIFGGHYTDTCTQRMVIIHWLLRTTTQTRAHTTAGHNTLTVRRHNTDKCTQRRVIQHIQWCSDTHGLEAFPPGTAVWHVGSWGQRMSWRAQHAEQESRGGIRSGHGKQESRGGIRSGQGKQESRGGIRSGQGKQESRGKFDLDKARKRNSLHVCYTVGFFEVRSCLS